MLARAACRILSVLCAFVYLVAGAHGGIGKSSARKHITGTLLQTVSGGGYPRPAVTAVRVSSSAGPPFANGRPHKVPTAASGR
jgi:hypothetical protein